MLMKKKSSIYLILNKLDRAGFVYQQLNSNEKILYKLLNRNLPTEKVKNATKNMVWKTSLFSIISVITLAQSCITLLKLPFCLLWEPMHLVYPAFWVTLPEHNWPMLVGITPAQQWHVTAFFPSSSAFLALFHFSQESAKELIAKQKEKKPHSNFLSTEEKQMPRRAQGTLVLSEVGRVNTTCYSVWRQLPSIILQRHKAWRAIFLVKNLTAILHR